MLSDFSWDLSSEETNQFWLFLPVPLCFTVKWIKLLWLFRYAEDEDRLRELQRASANSAAIASSTRASSHPFLHGSRLRQTHEWTHGFFIHVCDY